MFFGFWVLGLQVPGFSVFNLGCRVRRLRSVKTSALRRYLSMSKDTSNLPGKP